MSLHPYQSCKRGPDLRAMASLDFITQRGGICAAGAAKQGGKSMWGKAIRGAAILCALGLVWRPALAHQTKVAQNVAYVICMTTDETNRCTVHEPIEPCPAPSAAAFPKPLYSTVQAACAEARKLRECRGGIAGC